jgi:hypothetical protein
MPPETHPLIHASILWRPSGGGGDQVLKTYDNVAGMNITDLPALGPVASQCGDALVVRIQLASVDSNNVADVGAKLTLP